MKKYFAICIVAFLTACFPQQTSPVTTTTIPPTSTSIPVTSTTVPTTGMWKPKASENLSLHWVLDGPLNMNSPKAMGTLSISGKTLPEPDVYDIDGEYNSAATVAALHAKGKKVICYFDAGVYEDYRSDAAKFPQSVIGAPDEGWEGSYWLDIRQVKILEPIMRARIQMCKDKGFDMIEPDEITNYSNDSGFPLTYNDQLVYNKAIAQWSHEAGLSILLKGDIEQAADLEPYFDANLTEECYQYTECDEYDDGLLNFSNADKAVWIAEYTNKGFNSANCTDAISNNWVLTRYKLGLPSNGGRETC